ncbi:MAG: hypothetical protein ACTHKL_16005 [Streptosporangiaceae bacterium]
MTIHDEQDLRAKLGTALEEFAPGPVPFDAVVRQGRAVMIRKRITAALVGLAVLAALALVPTLLNSLHSPAPITRHYHVTVKPPTAGSPRGLVASGLVNHARWQFFARYNEHHFGLCLESKLGTGSCGGGRPHDYLGAPATLWGSYPEGARVPGGRWVRVQMVYGYVRHDVDRVQVDLSNGQVLTLHPVDLFGPKYARWVAIAVPFAAAVKEITVYSAGGELEHAIPFTGRGSLEIVRWLKPGQPDLPNPVSGVVGSGTLRGHHYVVRGYLGPWGICLRNPNVHMDICSTQSGALQPGTVVKHLATSYFSQKFIGLSVWQVEPTVSYVLVTRAKGSVLHLRPMTLGGQKYCVLPIDLHNHNVTWTAFDASGHLLANGSVSKLMG